MKLFIDSANLEEVEKAYTLGIIDGVTTNPTLIKQALDELKKKKRKIDVATYINELLATAKGTPVSLEVTKSDAEGMIHEGTSLYHKFNPIANNVCIKIPINTSLTGKAKNTEGLRAIKALSQARIPVNATLVFTPEQALMAAKAGAKYVSLFVGRVDDYIRTQHGIGFDKQDYFPAEGIRKGDVHVQDNGIVSGIDALAKTAQMFRLYGLKAELLAASIRNTRQLREVALTGAQIATVPFDVLQNTLVHPKTTEGIKHFIEDVPSEYGKLGR
jgi:transaldolase